MQTIEPDAERHLDRAAHSRRHVIQSDRHAHDEGVAQAACSRFWISLAACQCQGRRIDRVAADTLDHVGEPGFGLHAVQAACFGKRVK